MKPVKYLVNRKERELLRKYQINKEVQIKLVRLDATVNTKTSPKTRLIFCPFLDVSTEKFRILDPVNSTKRDTKHFTCNVCTYSSTNKHNWMRHSWTHSPHKRFKCDEYSYETNYKRHLQYHAISIHNRNTESRKRDNPCQLCSKSFFTSSALTSHVLVHTKEKLFSCQFCSKSFTWNTHKNCHEIICTQNPKGKDPVWVETQRRFQCKLCGKKILTSGGLTVHMRQHTQEKPYKCNQCEYAAASTTVLKNHVGRRHDSNYIKNFACELCKKLFVTKGELYQHIKTHTRETSCACRFCERQFVQLGNRNRHQIICKLNPKQNDEEWVNLQKKFKCELCDYSSTENSRLQRHFRIHAGTNHY